MTKILILTGIFPPDIGGPATQLDYLINDLKRNGFQIFVLTFGENNGNYNYFVRKISRKILWPFRNILYIFWAVRMSAGIKIIYAWDLYTAGFSGFLLKKIFPQNRFIVRFAGDSAWERARSRGEISENLSEFIEKKYGFAIEFRKWLRKKIMTSADKVVVVSYFLKGIAEKIGVSKGRLKVIYNSVDFFFKNFKLDKNQCRKGLNVKGVNLITAGRLVSWKGGEVLIEIMSELIKKYKDIYLWIIGEGPECEALKLQITNYKLQDNVFLVGKLSHEELFKYLKAGDIFVLNTDYEGLSHAMLEAMHIGIPIVATNVCSNPELIDDKKSGFLVAYNNGEEFKNAISALIDNPELGRKFVREAKMNLEKFKWENLIGETIAILKEFNRNQ